MMKSIFYDLWDSFKSMSIVLLIFGMMIGLSNLYKDAGAIPITDFDIQLKKWDGCYDRCADRWDKMIDTCLPEDREWGECIDRYEKQWDYCNEQCDRDYQV